MINPGFVSQGRALTRLGQEYRERYRSIYVDAPGSTGRTSRRAWTLRQLSVEYPERYRELYAEEVGSRAGDVDPQSIDPGLVGTASGPGPWHAVLADESATACGRTRFRTFPAGATRQMNCTYCADELRAKPVLTPDPQFREHAAAASQRIRELCELREQTATAEAAAFQALSALCTPPTGTAERTLFVRLIGEWRVAGLTLADIGRGMNLSRERIRQLAAEHAEVASC